MSQRDRSGQDRGSESEPRRDPRPGGRSVDNASSRPRQSSLDEEPGVLPPWQDQAPRSGGREPRDRSAGGTSRGVDTSTGRESRGASRREPLPQLGDAFRRPSRSVDPGSDEVSPASPRDPYDRLRKVASRPQRPVSFDDDSEVDDGFGEFGGGEYPDIDREPRPRPGRRPAPRPSERSPGPYRQPASRQIGGLIAAAAPQTRFVAAILGTGVISVVFMMATVAGRTSSLPDWLAIHLNAEGAPDRWGTPATLWRIPLMVVMLTIMAGAVAWFTARRDPFAARFALGSTILIHALCWIALVSLAW